jgi:DNA processing protein
VTEVRRLEGNVMEDYWLWLCCQKELYRPHIAKLIQYFGSPREVFQASGKALQDSGCLTGKQVTGLLKSRAGWDKEETRHQLERKGISFISAEQEEFPKRLKGIPDCPFGIFFKGKLPEDDRKTVGIVGARRCSYYGKQMAERLAAALAECGAVVVSGMALGIDGYAQTAALEAGGESLAVLGCGADVCYPRRNLPLYRRLEEGGSILSEYPPGREPLALHFPMRNRIISGMSDCVLVIEAKESSGSLITADLALEQGKDIYALPGRVGDTLSAGCNRLICQGAGIIISESELLSVLNFHKKEKRKNKKPRKPLETKEELLYSCVDLHPKSLQEIVSDIKLPVQEVMAGLTVLEMKGYVEEPRKNHYVRQV